MRIEARIISNHVHKLGIDFTPLIHFIKVVYSVDEKILGEIEITPEDAEKIIAQLTETLNKVREPKKENPLNVKT